ncbi:hypothetical protein ABIB51_001466 [Arthrobacter sp. UYCu712]
MALFLGVTKTLNLSGGIMAKGLSELNDEYVQLREQMATSPKDGDQAKLDAISVEYDTALTSWLANP